MSDPPVALAELFEQLSQELGEVTVERSGDVSEYARNDESFAVVESAAVEVRLPPEVAEAVLRTPHTSPSRRGEGWIRLDPPVVDRFVVDRADAWFRSAWRAAERQPGT